MYYRRIVYLFLVTLACVSFLLFQNSVSAQNNIGINIANYVPIQDSGVTNGMLVSLVGDTYRLANQGNSADLFGVVVTNPAAAFNLSGASDAVPIISAGEAMILVNGQGGPIAKGDFITISEINGVGMKAQNGNVIALAMENFVPENQNNAVLIRAKIQKQTANKPLLSLGGQINMSYSAAADPQSLPLLNELIKILRYLVAVLCLIFSLALGITTFGKMANRDIAALTSSPEGNHYRLFSAIFNLIMTVVIAATGIVITFIIILV